MKCIGFDVTEDHRTYSDGGNLNVAPEDGLPAFGERYTCRYPLREWGLDRVACGKIIADAGLPVPPKSACFFCPAMRPIEIEALRATDPDMYRLAIEMERRYRAGRHFRGDNHFHVVGKRKDTKEKVELDVTADDVASARNLFRRQYNDTVRPYKWDIRVNSAVAGLGRDHRWEDVNGH